MQTYKLFLIGCLLASGCAMFGDNKKDDTTLRIFEQISSNLPDKMSRVVSIPKANLVVKVDRYPMLTERDVNSAEIFPTAGGAAIMLRLEMQGMWRLDEITTRSRGRYLVTFLIERPVAVWWIEKRIPTGEFLLEGDFTEEEAKKAVESLNRQSKKRNAEW